MRKKKSLLQKKIIDNFDAQDIIAVIVMMGGFILMSLHIDTVVAGLMTLVVGYYFGKKSNK